MTLRTTGRRFRIQPGKIMTGTLLAASLGCLYIASLRQSEPETVSSGLEYVEDTVIQIPGPGPGLPDAKPFRRLLDHPEEAGIVILPWKEPVADIPSTDNLNVERVDTADSRCPVSGSAEKEEDKLPDTGGEPIISVCVTFHGNGGTLSVAEMTLDEYYLDISTVAEPRRLGKVFDGWYTDPSCTVPFTGIESGQAEVHLYAGWKEFPTYICDDRGYITGYTDADAVADDATIILPTSPDCLGVEAGAFAGLEDLIFDFYIPPNIVYIAPGVLESFPNLMYIEVADGNPAYYSDGGILYKADGTLYVFPAGRDNWGSD
ncbi:InlB B-repeat-containing protein [Dorea sp. D27]|uniref:InlB B-repeat-containing protein n=1 Tax=Dorea sp. D27 TaxID=658665 RepID=UPI0011C79EA0|nr:InlB B-repeat-containing protein [Dorea sp. D27]